MIKNENGIAKRSKVTKKFIFLLLNHSFKKVNIASRIIYISNTTIINNKGITKALYIIQKEFKNDKNLYLIKKYCIKRGNTQESYEYCNITGKTASTSLHETIFWTNVLLLITKK